MPEDLIKSLIENGELYLRIKVRPNAGSNKITGKLVDDTIKIDIKAPAEKGKANAELIKFLAKEFVVKKENVKIVSGMGDRIKLVKIKK